MEERMTHPKPNTQDGVPRRSIFGRAAVALALGAATFRLGSAEAETTAEPGDGPHWPGKLKGRHRQVVDGYEINGGAPLNYAHTFLSTNPKPGAATAVVVLRAGALPIALDNAIWEKYKIGESLKIIDPETKAAAVKNPFLRPKPGVLRADDMALDRLLAAGALVGACNIALHGMSKALAHNAGVSADEAAQEWAANLVPGTTLLPSGTWAVNRAQEAGCTYCTGGG
jgi:hypothetical protein